MRILRGFAWGALIGGALLAVVLVACGQSPSSVEQPRPADPNSQQVGRGTARIFNLEGVRCVSLETAQGVAVDCDFKG